MSALSEWLARIVRVADLILSTVVEQGTYHAFGVGGANVEDLYDAAAANPAITAVLAKHEFSAATMADGYSRSSARLGVVMATSGGGALNLVPGLGESLASRVPVLALVGQPPMTLDGRGSFQDTSGHNGSLDGQALFAAVSIYCRRIVSPGDIVEALPEAINAARRGGPAVLLLPKDIQQALIGVHSLAVAVAEPAVGDPLPILQSLLSAQGPVTIIAGEQVARDDARAELQGLQAALKANAFVVPDAKDVVVTTGQGALSELGVIGLMGHPVTIDAIADSAICLLVGTRLPLTARGGLDDALASTRILSLGASAPYLPCAHVHTDNLQASLDQLNRALGNDSRRPQRLQPPGPLSRSELIPPPVSGPGVRYKEAMSVLNASLPAGVDIVVDAGNTGAAAIHYLPARRDGRFVVALGMGGMGYSFGAGIGVAFARGRRTVVIAGDGSFFMHGMELHTAIQHRLPVTFILFNNNAHAMCVTREQLFFCETDHSYNRFRPSRLGAGVAAMFPDIWSVDVADIAELPGVLAKALATDSPSVLSLDCSADEIPPFAPFLGPTRAPNSIVDSTTERGPFDVAASA